MKRHLPPIDTQNSQRDYASGFRWKRSTLSVILVSCLFLCNTSTVTSFIPSSSQISTARTVQYRIDNPQIASTGKLKSKADFKRLSFSTSSSTRLEAKKKRPMPVVGYNAKKICEYYDRRPLVVGWRLNKLSLPLLGMFTLAMHF
jgi:hypothetical protein